MRALAELRQPESMAGRFPDARVRERLSRLADRLGERGIGLENPAAAFFVPGRIEVLGKHTDYAGGRSLVAATEQGIAMVATPRTDRRVSLTDSERGSTVELDLDALGDAPGRDWSIYPRVVARRMAGDLGADLAGAEIVLASDLPMAAGLSSSSALIIATYLALARCSGLPNPPELRAREDLAAYLGAVEAGRTFGAFDGSGAGVGTAGGNQDHTAILCSSRSEIRQYSYLPTRLERALQMPTGLGFAVAVSGIDAVKTGGARAAYNRASHLARQLTEIWNGQVGGEAISLGEILSTDPGALSELERMMNVDGEPNRAQIALLDRLHHFAVESQELVPSAGDAIAAGDLHRLGEIVDRSQELASRLLGNQTPETNWLAAAARDLGAVASSAFGAGFGGAVWALVEDREKVSFLDQWSAGYRTRYPARAAQSKFFWTTAGGPATELEGARDGTGDN